MGDVEGDDVVTQEELATLCDSLQALEAAAAGVLGHGQGFPGVGPVGGRSHQPAVLNGDLQVQGEAASQGWIW